MINSVAAYYHLSPADGAGASTWVQGGPRKGTENGVKECGAYLFNAAAISADLNGKPLPAAWLNLNRDTGYGTGPICVSMAPITDGRIEGAMTHEEAMNVAGREWHYMYTVTGESTRVPLPGYWLKLLKDGVMTGVLLYQEVEGCTSDPVRFTASAQLELQPDDQHFLEPYWMRSVAAGDLICSPIRSHIADIEELAYYINIRRAVDGLDPITADGGHDLGLYADWDDIILHLRTAVDAFLAAESQPAASWCTLTEGALPKALAINELRNYMTRVGEKEQLTVETYANTYFSAYNTSSAVDTTARTAWRTGAPTCGTYWGLETIEIGPRRKIWYKCFGFWVLSGLMDGKLITKGAKLRLTRSGGETGSQPITLYACIIDHVPTERTTVANVIDKSMICGSGSAAVGETVDIPLTDEAIAAMQSSTSGVYGVAVIDTSPYSKFIANATLILNEE